MRKLKYILYKVKKSLKLGDFIILIILLATAVSLIIAGLSGKNGNIVEIVSPNSIYRYPLEEDRKVKVDGTLGEVVIEINNGRIRLLEDKSPRKIAVKMGWVDIVGLSIICLPCNVSATIINNSEEKSNFDAMVE
jgi:hypothetical protein